MTDLYQSREISASRMANQRDKQALYETYKTRIRKLYMRHTKHAYIKMQIMKQQADGKRTLRGPWKYLTAQTSKQQEMDTHNLKR